MLLKYYYMMREYEEYNFLFCVTHVLKSLFETNNNKIQRHLFTIPIKLFINININRAYINGKYICPFLGFIWFVTILCIVAYKDS